MADYTIILKAMLNTAQVDIQIAQLQQKLNSAFTTLGFRGGGGSGGGGGGGGGSGGGGGGGSPANSQAATAALTAQIAQYRKLGASITEITDEQNNLNGVIARYSDPITKQAVVASSTFDGSIKNANGTLGAINTTFRKTDEAIANTSDRTKGWTKNIENNAMKVIQWALATAMIYGSLKKIQEGLQYVTALNKALVDAQIVTGMTQEQVNKLGNQYNVLAKQLGATTLQVADASIEFLRQGKTVEETQKLVTMSVMMSKLANMDAAESTTALTAIMNGYQLKVEDISLVLDKLIKLDNAYATSTMEISQAMQRSASAASLSGVSFDELASYITIVSATTRKSAESIGESFKTIFARANAVKAGENFDEFGDSINNVEKVLNKFDINLRDTTNHFIPLGTVLDEVGKKWESYSNAEQSQIAGALAGVRQYTNLIALFDNYSKVLEAQTLETNAAGLAQQRFGVYLQGVEAAQNKATAAWESFWKATIQSGALTWFYNLSASIGTFLSTTGGLIPALGTLLGIFVAIKGSAIDKYVLKTVTAFREARIASIAYKDALASQKLAQQALALKQMSVNFLQGVGALQTVAGKKATDALTIAQNNLAAANTNVAATQKAATAATFGWGNALGIILLVGSVVWGAIANNAGKAARELEKLNSEISDQKTKLESLKSGRQELEDMAREYDNLRQKSSLTKIEEQQLYDLQQKIYAILPLVAISFTDTGKAILDSTVPMQTYIDKQQKIIDNSETTIQNKTAKGFVPAVESYQKELDKLNELNKVKNTYIEVQRKAIAEPANKDAQDALNNYIAGYGSLETAIMDAETQQEVVNGSMLALQTTYQGFNVEHQKYVDGEMNHAGILKEIIDLIETLIPLLNDKKDTINTLGESVENYSGLLGQVPLTAEEAAKATSDFESSLSSLPGDLTTLSDAMEKAKNEGLGIADAFSLIAAHPELALYIEILGDTATISAEGFKALQIEMVKTAIAQSVIAKQAPEVQTALYQLMIFLQSGGSFATTKKSAGGSSGGGASSAKNALDDMISAIKAEKESAKQNLQDQLSDYTKIINARKEVLKSLKEESDYKDTIAEKNKALTTTENELLAISLDNSEEAKAKRLQLESDLVKEKEDIAKTERDRQYDLETKALDDVLSAFKDMIDAQIAEIDRYLKDTIRMTADAMNRIGAMGGGSSGSAQKLHLAPWATDTDKAYAKAHPDQYYQDGLAGGGIVTGGIPGKDSVLKSLMPGEGVLSKRAVDSLGAAAFNRLNVGLPAFSNNFSGGGMNIDNLLNINVSGNLDKSTVPDIEKIANQVLVTLNNALYIRGYKRVTNQYVS